MSNASQTDFDVDNYSNEDLLHILELQNKIPITKADIIDKVKIFIKKYENNQKFKKFFLEIETRLLEEKDLINDFDKQVEGIKNNDEESYIIKPENIQTVATFPATYKQGDKNPVKIEYINRFINFDSKFRTILNNSAHRCPDLLIKSISFSSGSITITHNIKQTWFNTGDTINIRRSQNNTYDGDHIITSIAGDRLSFQVSSSISTGQTIERGVVQFASKNASLQLDNPSNYNVYISQPLTNVLELKLETALIPISWYVFSSDYGTNSFFINDTKIEIDNGNYNASQLVSAINSKTSSLSIVFSYSSISNKITVANNSVGTVTIHWYKKSYNLACSDGGGGKVDYNLGWLLGFRNTTNKVFPGSNLMADSLLDTEGPKYLYIVLDDYVNNKPNQDIISISENKPTFKLPKYYNKNTMGVECTPVPKAKGCSNVPIVHDSVENLTRAQKYTKDQIEQAMIESNIDRYTSPTTTDILSIVPIDPSRPRFTNMLYTNNNENNKRLYFGPVNLKGFRVKLVNDKGYTVNLNKLDWSFTVSVKQLYEY